MTFDEVESIQKTCANAMQLWGYNIAQNEHEYTTLKPLKIFKLENYVPAQ